MIKYFAILILSLQIFMEESYFINPIISGAHPDTSICRVGNELLHS